MSVLKSIHVVIEQCLSTESDADFQSRFKAYYEQEVRLAIDGAQTKEEADAIILPLHAWNDATEKTFLDKEYTDGRGKRLMLGAIKGLQGVVSLSRAGEVRR